MLVVAVAVALVLAVAGTAAGTSRPWMTSAVGLGGAVVLILGSKVLGRRWLRRDEDHYERLAELAKAERCRAEQARAEPEQDHGRA